MRNTIFSVAVVAASMAAPAAFAAASETLWTNAQGASLVQDAPQPARFRALQLDLASLHAFLNDGARRGDALALPRPQGGFDEFVLSDSGVMPPQLAAKYPQIRSYVGIDAQGRQARIDVSPLGFQAMVFDHDGIWVIRPQQFGDGANYLSFARADLPAPDKPFQCGVHGKPEGAHFGVQSPVVPMTTTGTIKRNYVAAVAANHQYVIAVSPAGSANVANGLAAVVVAMNRVNQVYETDFAIHLTLSPNNDDLIYPTAVGDPYPNDDTAININTSHINSVIGVANYDIGHVFTTGSGGVAGLGVICAADKGDGTTGLGNPVGDPFYIDYVAHEMGHQFGGDHTFNGSNDNCGGGNRNGPTAYEPGSGSTIMAYAGICGPDNDLQPNSNAYFTASSLSEIRTYTFGATGSSCSDNTTNPNAVPNIAPLSNFIIPARTPFTLTGSATTTSSGTLSYDWEQNDLGSANNTLAVDPGNGPIIRSLTPTASGSRTIPRLSNLLAGTTMFGEILPTTNRTLHFRLTVRDNVAGFGSSNSADMTVQSVVTSAPFAVTAPNTAVSWAGGSSQNVSWNVAGTTSAPISCSQINLTLSTDGGLNFTQNLGTFANTGTASITVPSVSTTQARIKAACVGNIFFNISAPNFTVTAPTDVIFANGFQ